MTAEVLAAGIICWRKVKGHIKILLVHRPSQNDISLPKGKIDPGEHLAQTAVRELQEETGYRVSLGAPLDVTAYTLPNGKSKEVRYWTAKVKRRQAARHRFSANSEVSKLQWVSVDKAQKLLTYPRDRELIELFAERFEADMVNTYPIVVLRHAKAKLIDEWAGSDIDRPLRKRGEEQARALADLLQLWGIKSIDSSPALRCRQTVAPLAKLSDIRVREEANLWQDADLYSGKRHPKLITKLIEKKKAALICTHAPVVPTLLSELLVQTGSDVTSELRAAALLDTAEFAVLHLSKKTNTHVAVEKYRPAGA